MFKQTSKLRREEEEKEEDTDRNHRIGNHDIQKQNTSKILKMINSQTKQYEKNIYKNITEFVFMLPIYCWVWCGLYTKWDSIREN